MMHMKRVSVVKSVFELDSERLARSGFFETKPKESIKRFFLSGFRRFEVNSNRTAAGDDNSFRPNLKGVSEHQKGVCREDKGVCEDPFPSILVPCTESIDCKLPKDFLLGQPLSCDTHWSLD